MHILDLLQTKGEWIMAFFARLPRLAGPLLPVVNEAVSLSTPWGRKLALLNELADILDRTMVADGIIDPHPKFTGSDTSGYRLLEHAYAEIIQKLPAEIKTIVPVWDQIYLEQFFLPGDYNYTQQILLDAYHKGMRFEHVPVTFRKRETGESFISLSYPFKVLSQMVLVLTGVKPMKIFAPLGLFFLAVALGVFLWEIAGWMVGDAVKPVRSVNQPVGTPSFSLKAFIMNSRIRSSS